MNDKPFIPTIRGMPLGSCTLAVLRQERKEAAESIERVKTRLAAIDLAIRAKEDRDAGRR